MPVDAFKHSIRVRVNGLLKKNDALLLVQIRSPITNELVWMPPGGGLKFGESMTHCLQREFREETGLEISVESFAFLNEIVSPPFHAVECYFKVKQTGGFLNLGSDPELSADDQLLKALDWVQCSRLSQMNYAPEQLVDFSKEKHTV